MRLKTKLRRAALLKAEEESIQRMCESIASFKPDVVITEKVGEGWRVASRAGYARIQTAGGRDGYWAYNSR